MNQLFDFGGCRFASFDYTNAQGVVSTYKVLIGAIYGNAVEKNILALESAKYDDELMERARVELLTSSKNNLNPKTASNQSKAQNEAYTQLGKGLKIHNENGGLYLQGYCIEKTQTEAQKEQSRINAESGNFAPPKAKAKNPRPLTIAKDKVKKELELRNENMIMFKFTKGRMQGGRINGETFTL